VKPRAYTAREAVSATLDTNEIAAAYAVRNRWHHSNNLLWNTS
jgi:hypothetical protein